MTNILRSTAVDTIPIEDAVGNRYNLPVDLVEEFEQMDQEIVESLGDLDHHMELCDEWFEQFGRYEVDSTA